MNSISICSIIDPSRVTCRALFLALGLFFLVSPFGQGLSAQNRLHGVEKVVAIADIHGAAAAFESLLRETRLVDSDLNWVGAAAILVIVGDVLDRGAESRRVLELIQRLENQAESAGGRTMLVLGNHEIMNLVGDLRYVSVEEFSAYEDLEDQSDRETAFSRFVSLPDRTQDDEPTLRDQFNASFPPGFFGHRAAFSSTGPFGRWLLGKPVIVAVNDSAFAHAGIAARFSQVSLEDINRSAGETLNGYVTEMEELLATSVLYPEDSFYEQPRKTESYLAGQREAGVAVPDDTVKSASRLSELHTAPLFSGDSVTWYRGTASCSPAIERPRLEVALDTLGVERIVVGHTPTPNHRVLSRFDGQVIRADTGMLATYFQGQPAAIIITGSSVQALYPVGNLTAAPEPQPRRVAARAGMLSDDELERLFESVELTDEPRQAGDTAQLTLMHEGLTLNARFEPARDGSFLPQVAAYRLDRLLGFDLVPVAAAAVLNGETGTISLDLNELVHEGTPEAKILRGLASCPLSDQYNLMYLFDMLVHKRAGRSQKDIRYTRANGSLVLTGNGDTFGTQRNVPPYMRQVPLSLTPGLRMRLAALTEEILQSELGDVLGKRQRRALLARRNAILKFEAAN
jgi:hypothetical protein